MERSYTNSEGMKVTCTEEHLEVAVDVKLALQDKSPSRRISWLEHKKIMEEEGFFNSDTNEAYRCLIKDYQKKIGKLHNLPKYADLIHSSKLETMKRYVSDYRFEKEANKEVLREINKVYRNLTRTSIMVDEFKNIVLDDIDFSVPHYIYGERKKTSNNIGVLVLGDFHIGAIVRNCYGNSYNYEIACKRVDRLIKKTLDYCKLHNINDLYVLNLGDSVEHQYMRDNQSQDVEFSPSMQIAKATKLLFKLIINLAEYVNVYYGSIAGNHDRFDGNKSRSFDNDNANVVISEGLKNMVSILNTERINMLDINHEENEINLNLNNKKFKFIHGDKDRGNMKKRLKDHISMNNEFVDYLVHAHLHNFYIQEDDNGRIVMGIGSLMGKNNYSKAIGSSTDASQALIVVEDDGEIIPIRIGLQIS